MNARPLSVLVVEDEDLVREIVMQELQDAGFRVFEAADGDAAIAILAGQDAIDLLFTDIRLPGSLDGWGVAEQARRLRENLPVIYASGFSTQGLRLVPGSRFVKKPYAPSAIIDIIRELAA
ncbi:response regulator [Phenylobacterium sp.]|uniref:response regulator n=1 Tax=Phenylobacterium sp. TaxID=1871053 RepID=UPI002FCA3C07